MKLREVVSRDILVVFDSDMAPIGESILPVEALENPQGLIIGRGIPRSTRGTNHKKRLQEGVVNRALQPMPFADSLLAATRQFPLLIRFLEGHFGCRFDPYCLAIDGERCSAICFPQGKARDIPGCNVVLASVLGSPGVHFSAFVVLLQTIDT